MYPNTPKLSIIIPTHNEEKTIVDPLKNIESIDFRIGHEIIIFDDASVDRKHEEMMLYLNHRFSQGTQIRIVREPIKKGKGH